MLSAGAVVLAFLLTLVLSPKARELVIGRSGSESASARWFVFGGVTLTAGFLWLIWLNHSQADGEPFSLFEGISVWPTELIRLAAAFLGLGLLVCGLRDLKTSQGCLRRDFHLSRECSQDAPELSAEEKQECWKTKPWMPPRLALAMIWLPERLEAEKRGRIDQPEREPPGGQEATERVEAKELWRHYERWGLFTHRVLRILPAMLIFVLLALALMFVFGFPRCPYRGKVSLRADCVVLFVSVLMQVFLTFFVADAVRACRRFIQGLSSRPTTLPTELLNETAKKRNLAREYMDEWLDVRLIARCTRTVGKLIYFPFALLVLMILSRNSYFDRWDWPLSLVVLIGIISIDALAAAISLRRAAEKARRDELSRLKEKLLFALSDEDEHHPEQIRETIEEIESRREGAFAPLTQQPFFRANLLFLGGASSLPLAGYLPGLLGLTE